MIIAFLIIFIILTLIGFPVIAVLFPTTTSIFKISSAAYFVSLIIVICAAICFRLGLNINYSIVPVLLFSGATWIIYGKGVFNNLKSTSYKTKLQTIAIVLSMVFIGGFFLIYPSLKGAYGIYHARPDFYGYGMVASYLQQNNKYSDLEKTNDAINKTHFVASHWNVSDLREAVSIEFIIGSNRYGFQALAAVVDNTLFHDNAAVALLYPLLAISLIAALAGVYELLILFKVKKVFILFALLIVGFNINSLVAIFEGNLPSAFSLAIPLFFCLVFTFFDKTKKQKRISWQVISIFVILLSSELFIYQELMEVMALFLAVVFMTLLLMKDKRNMLNLVIAGVLFFAVNFDILINFLTLLFQVHLGFPGSYDIGFSDILTSFGLIQPYKMLPRFNPVIAPIIPYTTITLVIYFILFLGTIINYKFRKNSETLAMAFSLGVFCVCIFISQYIFKSNYVIWKLTYAFYPLLIISFILLPQAVKPFAKKCLTKRNKNILNKLFLSFALIISVLVVFNYLTLYRDYAHNSQYVFADESKAFQKGTYSDKVLLTMTEDQLYYLPGFHGHLYWLNSGWVPVFTDNLRKQKVTLVIFKQAETESFFDNAKHYFNKKILYKNDKIMIVQLNIPVSRFLTKANNTNRDFMQKYLDNLRDKINSSHY
jgi:hypothetical protein